MNTYYIKYRMHSADEEHDICLFAKNKEDAYDKAVCEGIPKVEGELPYSAWVSSVAYKNGNNKQFNTFEGKPY